MALKTFNLNEEIYKEFSRYCKANGVSMSKKIENFIKQELTKIKTPLQRKTISDQSPLHKYT